MKSKSRKQYTIRPIPAELDRQLRKRAREEDLSLNRLAIQILSEALYGPAVDKYSDLDFCIGSWEVEDEVEAALCEQRRIDPLLWR